jgi:hypothetical protein
MARKEDRRQRRISNNEFRIRNVEVRRVRRWERREENQRLKIKNKNGEEGRQETAKNIE